jgi:single-stranded-DNA-specific exonuclease
MGADQQHLRLKLRQKDSVFDAVAFKVGEARAEISPALDIVYNLEVDRWTGSDNLRLNVLSFNSAPG